MSAADADGATLAAISAAVDAFLREESAARDDESARRRSGVISAWRMAARTAAFGACGYGANVGWR